VLFRADSAFYGYASIGAALKDRADVSVTARMDPTVKRAIVTEHHPQRALASDIRLIHKPVSLGLGKFLMSDSDGLFPAAELEHVDPVVDDGVEVGAGVNKRFRAFEPAAVMLVRDCCRFS